MPKFCLCGNAIGPMSGSMKCRACKNKELKELRDAKRKQRATLAKINGNILLHSCLSDGLLDPAIEHCMCRKYVSLAIARQLVKEGRVVDMATRKDLFSGGPVVEKSRRLAPPLSSLGQRIAIQRKTEHRELDQSEIARLRSTAEEERLWKGRELSQKIELENAIALEERAKMIRMYDEAEWLALEKIQKTLPSYVSGFGHDERTGAETKRKFRTQKNRRLKTTAIRTESAIASEQGVEVISVESLAEAA